jgi:O-succinylbenzoate synthase
MRIERVRLFEVSLPLRRSFETSSHRKSDITHLLVEATTTDGVVGWGEIATPAEPYFGPETTETAWIVAPEFLAPALLGAEFSHPAELEAAWARVRGHEFAKAGFAGAAWDAFAQRRGESLAAALGGTRDVVHAGVSLGIEASIDALLEQVAAQADAGYGRVKLKIAPGWDVDPVAAVRSAYPRLDLHVDANAAYAFGDAALDVFARLDEYGLTMIEQPFGVRDFPAHQELQRRLDTPICLDESVVQLDDLETMVRMDAGRVLNIKVSRMGGLTQAVRAHDRARELGIPVWCGGMHEFGIGRAANIAVSSLAGFTLPSDVSGSDKYYEHDLIDPPVRAVDGAVRVPTGPGLGHTVRADRIAALATRTWDSARGRIPEVEEV